MEERNPMEGKARIVGLDLSKKTFVGCNLTGERFEKRSFFNGRMDEAGREKLASRLTEKDIVFMEGGTSSFNLARELKANTKATIIVLNPAKLHKAIASDCKTDKNDAYLIAEYARDKNWEKWCVLEVPTERESEYRSIITTSIFLTQERTKLINRLHAVFNQNGVCDLSKACLRDAEGRSECIAEHLSGFALDIALILADDIDLIERQMEYCDQKMVEICLENPELAEAWLSIPSVGLKTAATCIAFLGDCGRFFSADQLRNYVGLIPKRHQSGEVDNTFGVLFRGCMPIRRNLIQCAWSIRMRSVKCSLTEYSKSLYDRGKKGQKAAVAVANKILNIGYALCKSRSTYSYEGCETELRRKLKSYGLEAIAGTNANSAAEVTRPTN